MIKYCMINTVYKPNKNNYEQFIAKSKVMKTGKRLIINQHLQCGIDKISIVVS